MEAQEEKPGITTKEALPIVKPRKPVIAFLLSLIFPGLGQAYNGQLKKGIVFFLLSFVLQILFCRTIGLSTIYHLLFLAIFVVSFRIYTIIDAVINAKRQKEYILKRYNTFVHYFLFGCIIIFSASYFDFPAATGYQTFNIPSTANNPTLQVNDRVLADMRAYENNKPDYGDLVIFKREDGFFYVFRVVGLPNDTIEITGNLLTINGTKCKSRMTREFNTDEFEYYPQMKAEEWEETLPNGHKHLIYNYAPSPDSTKSNLKYIYVPPGSYYLLGDNRSNAMDCRYTGPLKEYEIEGQVLYSYWENTMNRINIDFRNQ